MKNFSLRYQNSYKIISCYESNNDSLCELRKRVRKALKMDVCQCVLTSSFKTENRIETLVMVGLDDPEEMKIYSISKKPDEISEDDILALMDTSLHMKLYSLVVQIY